MMSWFADEMTAAWLGKVRWRAAFACPRCGSERWRADRHGIPRCKHCGHETTFVRFQADTGPNNEPRLWVRCSRPVKDVCEGVQTILCKEKCRRA